MDAEETRKPAYPWSAKASLPEGFTPVASICFWYDGEDRQIQERKGKSIMKGWHWGIIVAVLVGYALGVVWPGPGSALRAKVGV